MSTAFFPAWLEQRGAVYSSCRFVEKYIGYNISLETFTTAAANPESVLYTRSFREYAEGGMHSYYGLVCSMFVSYALQLPYRQACAYWTEMPTIHPVDTSELENLQLCDIVLDPTHHIAMITDIQRDVNGKVHIITVSESFKPLAFRNDYTPEQFRKFWLEDGYSVHRYDLLDQITYEPDPFVYVEGDPVVPAPKINRALMLNFGNKANYRIGDKDELVEISVFEDGWSGIEVTDPNGKVTIYHVADGKLQLAPEIPGYYTACLVKDGAKSDCVEWCMVNIEVSFDKDTVAVGEPINIHFKNSASDEKVFHYVINNDKFYPKGNYYFSEEEDKSGKATVPAAKLPGKYYVIVMARNAYGVYTSRYTEINVE